jgi:eukaryotic-like serine/threonine-protein kinase
LEDLLGILEFVHAQGVIHRDIKPSNLIRRASDGKLVLIDFGAVKTIRDHIVAGESKERADLTVGIGTQGYMPREQLAGHPRFNSDIYAVGMIAIKAITGINPADLPQELSILEIIRQNGMQVSDRLAEILDKMVCYHCSDRYQSATEVLEALRQFKASPDKTWLTKFPPTQIPFSRLPRRQLLMGAGALTVAAVAVFLLAKSGFLSPSIPETNSIVTINADENAANWISSGSKILTVGPDNPAKQEGVDFMASGEYQQAVSALEAARKINQSDPEILIYLNNARIGNAKSYAIAAAVPVGDTPDSANEMLRGVAQAQDEINAAGGINGVPLKVAIANDNNRPEVAKAIAKELVKNPEILGVVGHGVSDTTLAAGAVYQSGELVAIAPVSSAIQLSGMGRYVFRTMPSDRYTARALSTYLLTQLKKQKAVVFYNSNSVYSQSLKNEFKDALFYLGGGQVVQEFDLSRPDFKARESVEKAIKKEAEALVLLPSNEVSDRALQVVQINGKRLKLIAGDGFYTPKTLDIGGEEAVGMVLAVPGSLIGERGEKFRTAAFQLWGEMASETDKNDAPLLATSNQMGVNWRTALAYDATQALIAAIGNNPTRRGVQRSLSAADFSILGATGSVSFRPTGDREAAVQLVTVVSSKNGYKFEPLEAGLIGK